MSEKSIERIYSSLENLLEYFGSKKSEKIDKKTRLMIESGLLKMEGVLRLSEDYKPPRRKT